MDIRENINIKTKYNKEIDLNILEREIDSFWSKYSKSYKHLENAKPHRDLVNLVVNMCDLRDNDKWTDLFTGSASIARALKRKCDIDITAIDGSEFMLQEAREKIEEEFGKNKIELLLLDLKEGLPMKNNSLDGVVSNLGFPYIWRISRKTEDLYFESAFRYIIKECYRVLKEGGQLVWSTPVYSNELNFNWVFIASIWDMLKINHPSRLFHGPNILKHAKKIESFIRDGIFTSLSQEDTCEILQDIGFKDIKIQRSFGTKKHQQAIVYSMIKM